MPYYGGVRRYGSYKKYSGRYATAHQRRMHAIMVPYARRVTPGRPAAGLFPPTLNKTLRYVQTFICRPPVEAIPWYVLRTFRANSVWDPDLTGGGFSAKGYEFYRKYYNHVTVLASRCNLQITGFGSSAVHPFGVFCKTDDDGQYFTKADYRSWMCDSAVRHKFFKGGHYPTDIGVNHMTVGFNSSRFFGVPDIRTAQRDFGSQFGYNPNDMGYWQFAVATTDMQSPAPLLTIVATIDYACYFTERKDQIGWDGNVTNVEEVDPPVGGGDPDPAGPIDGVPDETNPEPPPL